MPNWTKEQQAAINTSGTNIIVSAGAGSGKTAVLTERVITKLRNGININELLIMTFTNAAAAEMKDRIRASLKKDINLKEQLNYIDSAYICTFDSFSIALVKKYHYLLNVSPQIGIIEKSICDTIRQQLLEEIFEEKYNQKEQSFVKMINDLTIKDDKDLKKNILDINNKLDRIIDKEEYLNNYLNNYYSKENIDKLINEFNKYLKLKLKYVDELLERVSYNCPEKYYNELSNIVIKITSSKTYEELKNNINEKIPSVPRQSEEILKINKKKLSDTINNLKKILIYKDEDQIKNTLLSTYDYASAIIDIILELDKRLNKYKQINDQYEYNDIAKMAISLVKNNSDVQKELKESFKEIMVDEYQDTSDIQETLISLINNNNLYMVGDIKQSIYRFRNANPKIFKEKYLKYSNHDGGIKIDLLNNFRSRKEVLDNINTIFSLIMDITFGGANYEENHQMNFGNNNYTDKHPNQNFNLEIYNYKKKNKKYRSCEYEAFIIAKDISNKIASHYQVIDKKTNELRDIGYGDFCILLDRKTNFELYKKIFEYLGIPLVIYYDEKITNEKDILIIKNIIDLVINIYNHNYNEKFKYDFYSISRSYISDISDSEYLDYYINNNYRETGIYKKCELLSKKLDTLSSRELIEEIIKEFNFYERTIQVGEMEKFFVRIDYLKMLADNLSSLGYSIMDFNNYLQEMTLNDSDITFSLNAKVENNVKLMNIHKSKGLEFSVCYYAGYDNKFNRRDLNNNMNFDNDLGFILPFYNDGIGNTITKQIFKEKYNEEDISERIRLFYVALTRAKEKMIIVSNLSDNEIEITDDVKREYVSFKDILESVKKNLKDHIININDVNLTKKYIHAKEKDLNINNLNKKIKIKEINIENNDTVSSQVSKHINKLITEEESDTLKYGTKMHRLFEVSDFNKTDNETIVKFKKHFPDMNNCNIYKEYEFITTIDEKEYHGIIDLILEYSDHIDIVDYKLKNIKDDNYKKQLEIYKEYISTKANKNINIYLYSIMDDYLEQL